MIEGIYTAAASLSTLEKWQASISQNLASSSVAGFKKSSFAVETDDRLKSKYEPDGVSAARHTGGMPTQKTSVNFAPGDIKSTGKATDLAIGGPGFFQIKGEDNKNLYTRDGEFQFNSENILVTKQGLPVIGDAGEITIDPERGPVTFSRDGTISQGDNQLGKLSLYDFDKPEGLVRVEGGFFEPSAGIEPKLLEKVVVTQGAIESSNVTPMAEMVNMIAVSRAYEAAQRAMTSHDDLISKAISTLGTPSA